MISRASSLQLVEPESEDEDGKQLFLVAKKV
jgi:hypothetical protein